MQINRNSVLYNASVMTVAGLLLQVIGFVYRIYLSRMAGPEGLGIYRLILPVPQRFHFFRHQRRSHGGHQLIR